MVPTRNARLGRPGGPLPGAPGAAVCSARGGRLGRSARGRSGRGAPSHVLPTFSPRVWGGLTKVRLRGAGGEAGGRGYVIATAPMWPVSPPSRRRGMARRAGSSHTQFPPHRCQVWGAQSWRHPASAPPRAWIVRGATPAERPTTSRPEAEGDRAEPGAGPGPWARAAGAGRAPPPVGVGAEPWRRAQRPPPFPSWPLGLAGNARCGARRRGVLAVGVRGPVRSFRTPGGLRRIPASQAGGAPGFADGEKGDLSARRRTGRARPGSHSRLSPPALRALRAPADAGLLWPPGPASQPGSQELEISQG